MFQSFKFLFLVAALVVMATWFITSPNARVSSVSEASSQAIEPDQEFLNRKLVRILQEHPDPLVSHHLLGKLMTGEIGWHICHLNEWEDARYSPGGGDDQSPSEIHSEPLLHINFEKFSDPSYSDDWWTLVLFHEAVHHRQDELGQLSLENDQEVLVSEDRERIQRHFEKKWYAEREAYHEECQLARELGTEALLPDLCRKSDPAWFDRRVTQKLMKNETNEVVRAIYARLAFQAHY